MRITEVSLVYSKINPDVVEKGIIRLEGEFDDFLNEAVNKTCHKWKHLFLSGFPCGRHTRKKLAEAGTFYQRWPDCPNLSMTYYFQPMPHGLEISVMIGNRHVVKQRFSEDELILHLQDWQQYVAEELEFL